MSVEKPQPRFVLCIRNEGSDDLEPRKVYRVLPDLPAARDGYVRVIDVSGEGYLYPADYFAPVRSARIYRVQTRLPLTNTASSATSPATSTAFPALPSSLPITLTRAL